MKIQPKVSIVIPLRNEKKYIQSCLEAVLAQDYAAEKTEVIIADGVSDDGTREIVQSFQARYPNIKLIDNPGKIVAAGLNKAILESEGEIIIRIDGHCEIAPDYVRQCVEVLKRTGADNAGGRMNAAGENYFGRAVAMATSHPFGIGGGRFHYSEKEESVDTVYLGAWPREVFDRIGVFDEELVRNQDDEFNYRLRKSGGRILLSPKIKSKYITRSTPKMLWKQYFEYGFWKVRVLQKHPRQMQWRQFAPPFFVLFLLFSLFFFRFISDGKAVLTGILSLYLCVSLLMSFLLSVYRGIHHFFFLPIVFAILHLSYGFGFLYGLVYFSGRWKVKHA